LELSRGHIKLVVSFNAGKQFLSHSVRPKFIAPSAGVDATGRRVITFNGEIYNYRGLRLELERRGRTMLINVVAEWGEVGESANVFILLKAATTAWEFGSLAITIFSDWKVAGTMAKKRLSRRFDGRSQWPLTEGRSKFGATANKLDLFYIENALRALCG